MALRGGPVRRGDVRLVLLLPLLLLATACAAAPDPAPGAGTGQDTATGDGVSRAENDLIVEMDGGNGAPVERFTLVCGASVEGTHPDARAACEHLAGMADPFAPIPDDAMCTEIYGGPQTATVTGTLRGERIDARFSRSNGCEIARWDRLAWLLGRPRGP